MSRLVAYIGNDPKRVRCVLHPGQRLLVADRAGIDGWGIGFYQGGELLLRRRPKPPEGPVDFYEIAGEVQSDVLIGQVRTAATGSLKNENTPPFRFRSWLFAHAGAVPRFEEVREQLLGSVPDFLRRNVRGQTDSEHIFHLFLSFLHDAGKLDDAMISIQVAGRALAEAIALVGKLSDQTHAEATPELNIAVTNGRILLAARRGSPLCCYRLSGVRDCTVCRAQVHPHSPSAVQHEHLRGVVMVADPSGPIDAPWEAVPDNHIVAVSHDLNLSFESL